MLLDCSVDVTSSASSPTPTVLTPSPTHLCMFSAPWAGRAQSLPIWWCWCSPRAYTWPASRTVISSLIVFHDQICVSSTNLSSEFQNNVGTIYQMTLDRCSRGTWTQYPSTTSSPINSFASVFPTHPHTQTRNQHPPTSLQPTLHPITHHCLSIPPEECLIRLPSSFSLPWHCYSSGSRHSLGWDNFTSCVPAFPASRLSPPLCSLHTAVTVMF